MLSGCFLLLIKPHLVCCICIITLSFPNNHMMSVAYVISNRFNVIKLYFLRKYFWYLFKTTGLRSNILYTYILIKHIFNKLSAYKLALLYSKIAIPAAVSLFIPKHPPSTYRWRILNYASSLFHIIFINLSTMTTFCVLNMVAMNFKHFPAATFSWLKKYLDIFRG